MTEDGTFEFNEFGINFGKELTDKLRVSIQFFSKDLGSYGNNKVVLDYAFGDYRWKDWLGVRAGLLKALMVFTTRPGMLTCFEAGYFCHKASIRTQRVKQCSTCLASGSMAMSRWVLLADSPTR